MATRLVTHRSVLESIPFHSIVSLRLQSTHAVPQADEAFDLEWQSAKPYHTIPSPTTMQLIKGFKKGGRYADISITEMHKRWREDFGNLIRARQMFGKPDVILSFCPDDYEKLYRSEGVWPFRRTLDTIAYYRQKVRPEIFGKGGGLTTVQGEEWQKMRTMLNPVMMNPKTVQLYVNQMDEVAREFMTLIADLRDVKHELPDDFDQWLNRWSLETMGVLALNTRFGMLKAEAAQEVKAIITMVRDIADLTYRLDIEPSIWKFYKTATFKKLMKLNDDFTNVIMAKVDEAIVKYEKHPTGDGGTQSVLEKLLNVNKNVAVVMSLDLISAGVDSTSSAVSGVLYCLAKDPARQSRLRAELKAILPQKDSPLTGENMRNLPYLRACIKEGLRLYQPTIGNIRTTARDLVLQGYQIPKGTDVAMLAPILQRDQSYFPQPEAYLPERWLSDRAEGVPSAKDSHPFIFLPFGFGARSCIGKRMAMLEIEIIVARIVRQFELRWNYEDLKMTTRLISVPANPLKFELNEVEN